MTSAETAPAPAAKPRPPRWGRRASVTAGVVVLILALTVVLVWLNRRAATRQVLVGWLEQQGVDADMEVERVEMDGLTARIRIGDPRNPDVIIDRVEVDYAIGTPWSKQGLGVTPSRIRLVRPVVRASFRNGKFSLGSLDPLIEKFTGRPPRPDSRSPLVIVERGRMTLDTDYGAATVLADARVDNGKLMRLSARLPETTLKSGEIEGRDVSAAVELTTTGDRVALQGWIGAAGARLPGVSGQGARLNLTGNLPYPDLKTRRGDGRAAIGARLTALRFQAGEAAGRQADVRLSFDGQTSGWIEAFRIEGRTDLGLGLGVLSGPANARDAALSADGAETVVSNGGEGLGWSLIGPARLTAANAAGAGLTGTGVVATSRRLAVGGRKAAFEVEGPVALAARRLTWDEMTLDGVRGQAALDVVSDEGVRVTASGSLGAARGAWPLFGPAARDDIAELGEMKRALSNFAVQVPAFNLIAGDAGTRLTLARPATLRPANGGVLTINPVSTPIFSAGRGELGGGALSLTATRGKGLPEAAFAIPAWRLTPSGFTATLDGRAALDFDLAKGITLQTRGELASSNGVLTYVAARCIPLTVERLELDENDVTDISG
ncbi:MAG: C4-dicarboxylate ABC transporter, partial [Brevundimonas sp.]